MSRLQHQLQENKGKIKRDKFLSQLDEQFSNFLSTAEFSSDASCINNAAYPRRNRQTDVQTTSRGDIKNWNNFKFKSWQDLILLLKKFREVKNYIGWFFVDTDGPYYRISLNAFLTHIDELSNYATKFEHYDFGWVGSPDDVGIIIGFQEDSSSSNKYGISIWGM